MSSPATLPIARSWDLGVYRGLIPALGAGLVLLGLLFPAEVAAAVATWIDSTAYNHCFLVLPIAFYLAWDRRDELQGVPIAADLRFVVLAVPVMLVWLVAERLGIMEGRQLMVICLVQVLFLTALGWRMWKRLSGPLLYLFFLVPFGAFLTPVLQDFTAAFTIEGLNLLGIPNYSDGYIIEIAQGVFYVAEACAGLRFLIASVAFGVLYALILYRSPRRRAAFIVVSIVTPIIANGFRALGIVVLGRYLGSAQAAGADHLIYGWVFFSFVLLMLVLLGLPFREDGRRPAVTKLPPRRDPVRGRPVLIAGVALIAVAAVGPVAAGVLDRSSRDGMSGIGGVVHDGACVVLASFRPGRGHTAGAVRKPGAARQRGTVRAGHRPGGADRRGAAAVGLHAGQRGHPKLAQPAWRRPADMAAERGRGAGAHRGDCTLDRRQVNPGRPHDEGETWPAKHIRRQLDAGDGGNRARG